MVDAEKASTNVNGWGEYKREVLLRLDTVEGQLTSISTKVSKVDRELAILVAQRSSSRWLHNLLVPGLVAAIVALFVKLV